MPDEKLSYSLKLFYESLQRLSEALEHTPKNETDLAIDGTIQRFEFTFEMSWKTLKRFLNHNGIEAKTPRDCFKQSFKLGWLTEGDDLWMRMIDDRNSTSHTYNRELAQKVYSHIMDYHKAYNRLYDTLKSLLD